jgi:hypothetical protein
MSKATVRHLTGHPAQRGVQDLLVALPQLASRSIDQYASLLSRTSQLFAGLIPAQLLSSTDCCEIPEQECPPHCVCEIAWEACRGETVKASIRVRNTSSQSRNFAFSAGPMQGQGSSPGAPTVSPTSRQLRSGESVDVAIELPVTEKFEAGERYEAKVLIRGAYEQCVIVRLDVVACPSVRCEVDQGDPPVRIRAHQWYDHFQCTEPCERGDEAPRGTTPHHG